LPLLKFQPSFIKINVYWDVTLFRLVDWQGHSEKHSAWTVIPILRHRQTLFHDETLLLMFVPHHNRKRVR